MLQVYTVSGGKNIPAWLSDKKKKTLRKDEEYRRRIELIQVCAGLPGGAQPSSLLCWRISRPAVPPAPHGAVAHVAPQISSCCSAALACGRSSWMHPEVPLLPSCSPAIARLPQDFEFPAGCQRIKVTPDGQYIFASGYHPPQVPQGRAELFAPSTVR